MVKLIDESNYEINDAFRQTDEVAQQGHARIRALLGVELNAEGDRARLHDARERNAVHRRRNRSSTRRNDVAVREVEVFASREKRRGRLIKK